MASPYYVPDRHHNLRLTYKSMTVRGILGGCFINDLCSSSSPIRDHLLITVLRSYLSRPSQEVLSPHAGTRDTLNKPDNRRRLGPLLSKSI